MTIEKDKDSYQGVKKTKNCGKEAVCYGLVNFGRGMMFLHLLVFGVYKIKSSYFTKKNW